MERALAASFFVMVISVKNQQSYDFLYVVNFGLSTQLALGALWIASWFPISFRPQDAIFKQMRRFFTGCERLVSAVHDDVRRHRLRMPLAFHLHEVSSLPGKIGRWMAAFPIDALNRGTREETQSLANSLQELGDGMRALIESREAVQSETIRRALTADMHAWRMAIQEILRRLSEAMIEFAGRAAGIDWTRLREGRF